ncbi:MAG: hypothetical protein ACPG49_10950, partial [Chitinophagales bacterium]
NQPQAGFDIEDLRNQNRNIRPIQATEQLPDLVVVDVRFEFDIFSEGENFGTVKYLVQNMGNAPAKSHIDDPANGGYFIDLFLSSDAMSPEGLAIGNRDNHCEEDVLLIGGRTSGKTIEAGESVWFVDENLVTPIGCQECLDGMVGRQFGINIDPDNKVKESNEHNNDAFRTVMIKCDPNRKTKGK